MSNIIRSFLVTSVIAMILGLYVLFMILYTIPTLIFSLVCLFFSAWFLVWNEME